MKKRIKALLIIAVLVLIAASPEQTSFNTSDVNKLYRSDIEQLNAAADSLLVLVRDRTTSREILIASYANCRYWFKRSESLTEYLYPATAKLLNGPLIPEAEVEAGSQVIEQPQGLQVIEEIVYSDSVDSLAQLRLLQASWKFVSSCRMLRQYVSRQSLTDWQIMDALKQEVVRVFTLGITGFDTPASGNAIPDAATAIEGVQNYISVSFPDIESNDKTVAQSLTRSLKNAESYLTKHDNFDSFDRMEFIRDYANPLYGNIVQSCDALEIIWPQIPSAVRKTSKTIFEKDALNPWFYSRDNHSEMQRMEVAELGKLLFFDPVLSGDGQRACASCHEPEHGFTDGSTTSLAFSGGGSLQRNSPTIINSAFQASYFYDVRARFLEDQIRQVVNNKDELHGDFTLSVNLIRTSGEYRVLFSKAFAGTRDTAISSNAIVSAISAYERTLISNNSRFDRHIRGEGKFMNNEEIAGFNLFMGKAQCGTCHFLPMFNGTVPPAYVKTETEVIGVPQVSDTVNSTIDPDVGRLHTSGSALHKFAFKTPGIRNVALTAPYMHNGVFKTLTEVVEFYNRGGGIGAGQNLPNQTLPGERLHLTEKEKISLVKFMECLTDTSGLTQRPTRLPAFEDSTLNSRKIGGVY